MAYVLVILIISRYTAQPSSATSVDFETVAACQAAADVLGKLSQDGAHVSALCFPRR